MNGQSSKSIRIPLPGRSTAQISQGVTHILHSDWLGSAQLSTFYSPVQAVNDTSYAPYGEAYGGPSSELDFTGQRQDTISGLYDFLYREYDPVQGRWISPDPAGLAAVDMTNPQSWNRYAYVLNNPLSAIDPTGLDCVYPVKGGENVLVVPGDCQPDDEGFYFDGTVDPNSAWINGNGDVMATVNGTTDCSGECPGASTVTGQQGSLLQLLTTTAPIYVPHDVPLSPSGQVAAVAIHNALAKIPNPCSMGVQASVGNTSATASLSDAGLQGQISYGQYSLGSVQSQTQGAPLIPAPPNWLPDSAQSLLTSPVNAQMQGRNVLSVSVSKNVSLKKASVSVSAWLNFGGC